MTTITISDASFTVSGKLVAGDTILVRLDNVGLQEDARVRLVITAIPPPDARHLVAATGLLSSAKLETQLLLKSTELRNALQGAHVSEAVPVMIEAIDEAHACVLGALRYQIENSAALWIGSAQKYPIPDPIYALSYDLKRHESDQSNPHAVTASQIGADASGTAAANVSAHNTSKDAHADIRGAVSTAQSSADRAIESAQAVSKAINAHAESTENPHGVTEDQVIQASGSEYGSKKYLRTFDNDPKVGTYTNETVTHFGKTIFKGDIDCSNAKIYSLEVPGGAIVTTVLAVFGGPIYIDDLDNPGQMHELSVRGGKLYFDNDPISADSVRSLKA